MIGFGNGLMFEVARPSASSVLLAVDFTTQTPGVGAMPTGFTYSRASTATVQTSASTMQTGLAVDAVPIVDRGGGARLCFEAARTNGSLRSHDYALLSDSGAPTTVYTPAYAPAPDGTNVGVRVQVVSGGWSKWTALVVAAGVKAVGSWWARVTAGTGVVRGVFDDNGSNPQVVRNTGATTTWARYSAGPIAINTTTARLVANDGRNAPPAPAEAIDVVTDGHQIEAGGFPTSLIVTGAALATRSGARLRHTSPANVVIGGRIEAEFDLEPHGASTEYTADGAHAHLLYIDASNYARWVTATRVVEVCVGGVTYSSPALPTWTRGQRVRISVAMGNGAPRVAAVVGAGSYALIGVGAAQAALSIPASIDLLCAGTAGQFSADVRGITFYANGQSPASLAV